MTTEQVVQDPGIAEAIRHCEQVTRLGARNFYHGLRLAPEPKRSAMYTLYAWMRRVDDIVDDPASENPAATRGELQRFSRLTQQVFCGQLPRKTDPLWPAMAFLIEHFPVRWEDFSEMIQGQLDDIEPSPCATFEDLYAYCYRVASTVGLLSISIWGYTDPAAREFAIDRGIAFQLTNILRDFSEDFDSGRVYLPTADFERFGLSAEQCRVWEDPARCEQWARMHIERAQMYYERSSPLDNLIDASCRPMLWAMTSIYREVLGTLERAPQRMVNGRRARLSPVRKAWLAWQAKRMAGQMGIVGYRANESGTTAS